MKATLISAAFLIFTCCAACAQLNNDEQVETTETFLSQDASEVDYSGFSELVIKLQPLRNKRLITTDQFKHMAKKRNTIILDTRSKAAYDEIHVKGAVHLNFSDFTEEKLAKVIPSKDTRILIYCNNNFITSFAALASKKVELALNIPTFVNLYGYGYKNVYELGEMVVAPVAGIAPVEGSPMLELAGSVVSSSMKE